jgi:hypothetical protein
VRSKLSTARGVVAGLVVGGLVATGVGALAATNNSGILLMNPSTALRIACPNPLTNTDEGTNSETVNCGTDPNNTDTTTTTTTDPTTSTSSTSSTTSTSTSSTTSTSTSTTTTTDPQTSGGNCTNPSFSTSEATGTENTDPGPDEFWWVDNDAWSGSHGPQTIYVCSPSSWYAVSNQPNNAGAVETYPNTEYDVGGRQHPTTTPISDWKSITSTFSEAFPSAGSWDAAYDLWLNDWGTEIMIWNQWSGAQSYWPSQATTAVTLGGVPYHFLNNGGELMFFRDSQVSSGSVDILAALQWLAAQGIVKSSDVPTQLEYGVEICSTSGSETFPLTGLTFNLS